jgi:hypothetical protein
MTLLALPGSAYIQGAHTRDGQWVLLRPMAGRWPEGVAAPLVGVGRVAELFENEDAARVELLTLLAPGRAPFAVEGAPRLSGFSQDLSLSKRLITINDQGDAPVGVQGWVTGEEVYGVLPPLQTLRTERRISAQLKGLVTLDPDRAGASRVLPWIGDAPSPGDHLLLLGSRSAPALEVQVVVVTLPDAHPLHGQEESIREAVEEVFAVRGLGHISVRVSPEVIDTERAFQEAYSLKDNTLRVFILGDAFLIPWERLGDEVGEGLHPAARSLSEKPPPYPMAEALAVEVHALLGQHVAKAFLLETWLTAWLTEAPSPDAWLALGPALISAYRRMRRDDWALETFAAAEGAAAFFGAADAQAAHALRLEAALALADQARLKRALDLLPSVAALLPTLREAALWRLARAHIRQGEPEAARALLPTLRALTQAPLPPPADALHAATLQRADRLLFELDRMDATDASAATNPTDATERRARPEHTQWFVRFIDQQRHLAALADDPIRGLDALSAFALGAQDIACPGLVYDALLAAALTIQPTYPAISARLLTYAAWSAQSASRPWIALDALAAAPFDPAAPWPEPLLRWYERALATLDLRAPLALHTLRLAATLAPSQPDRARLLLDLARNLFLTSGDAANVAAADYHLARLEASLDLPDAARRALARGLPFERASHYEALRLFREQIEATLNDPSLTRP